MSTVLLVDDSPTIRQITSKLLESQGLKVLIASDGIEAIELLEAKKPDLVILDIIMPRMNGYDVCRWLKSNPKTQHIPVIFWTVKSENIDRYWGMKQGGDAYITKPLRAAELIEAIRKLLPR